MWTPLVSVLAVVGARGDRVFTSRSSSVNYTARLHEHAVYVDSPRAEIACDVARRRPGASEAKSVVIRGLGASEMREFRRDLEVPGATLAGRCVEDGRGFYGRVETVDVDGASLRVRTRQAGIDDIFADLSLHARAAPRSAVPREAVSRFPGFDDFVDGVGDFIDEVGDFFDPAIDFVSDAVSSIVEIAGAAGLAGDLEETLGEIGFNHDFDTGDATRPEITLLRNSTVCEECHIGARVVAGVDLEFSALGGLEILTVYVEGSLQGGMHLRLQDLPTQALEWIDLQPFEADAVSLSFSIGPIPVWIDLITRLEGGVATTGDVVGSAGIGAEIAATAKLGIEYQANEAWGDNSGWAALAQGYWDFSYTNPYWRVDDADAVVNFYVSPQFVFALWDTIPVVLKLFPHVDATLSTTDDLCAAEDARYTLSYGVDVGVGVDDIQIPDQVNGVTIPIIGGYTLIGGHDFGEFSILDDQPFPGCLELCDGCLSTYASLDLPDFLRDLLDQSAQAVEEALPGFTLEFVNQQRILRGAEPIDSLAQVTNADYLEYEAYGNSAGTTSFSSTSLTAATSKKKKSNSGWTLWQIALLAVGAALVGALVACAIDACCIYRKRSEPNKTHIVLPPWPVSESSDRVAVPADDDD